MLKLLRDLFRTLSPAQRRRFAALQILVVLRTFAEIASVTAIGPFTMLVSNMDALQGSGWLARGYRLSGAGSPEDFLILLGLAALAVLLVASLLSIYTTFALFRYSHNVGAEISTRLFDHYMHQPWLYHTSHNSSILTKRIAVESTRITRGILTPFMQLNASLVLAVLMSISLCWIEPVVTVVGVGLFSLAYLSAYRVVRRKITLNGTGISHHSASQYRLMAEGFGGIREVLLRDSQEEFVRRFGATSSRLSESQARNSSLAQAPRYIIELAALAAVIFAVIYLVLVHDGDVAIIVPLISVYGLAAFKLLPALQKVYSSFVMMKGAQAAHKTLRADLQASAFSKRSLEPEISDTDPRLLLRDSIELRGVVFSYPGKQARTLDDLNMTIPAGTITGLVGVSGAGKSTLIDILLGLVAPNRGEVLIDSIPMDVLRQRKWRRSVGFVPQAIYLADSSIAENIAFGIHAASIDMTKVETVIKLACLDDLIDDLPEGLGTNVGERGVQLSGGQRQRIGIARALYRDPEILILDEATNALDVLTERRILDAVVNASAGRTTLIVAHRLKTLTACDVVYFMERGRISASGTYADLAANNQMFRKLDLLS